MLEGGEPVRIPRVRGSASAGTVKNLTFLGRSQMPYAPVDIRGTLDGSPQDWTITFERRSRTSGAWKDHVDVPLGETTESYECHILDTSGSPSDNLVRILTSTTKSFTYTDGQQQSDFGAVQTTLTVKVYQLNDVVGRGFAGRAVIEDGKTISWIAEAA